MLSWRHSILLFLLAVASPLTQAQSSATDQARVQAVLDLLAEHIPEVSFSQIRVTELAGYYRVDMEMGPTLYVAADASHFFAGDLYRIEGDTYANATQEENALIRLERLAEIADEDKIIFGPQGTPRAVLTVFTDVTCTFCRRMHSEIDQLLALGIEVQYLAFPRSGIERNGMPTAEYLQTARAWCADDRQAALTALKDGNTSAGRNCTDNPVAVEYQLGLDFGVTGTPAIVLPDGSLLPGYRTPAEFARLLGIVFTP